MERYNNTVTISFDSTRAVNILSMKLNLTDGVPCSSFEAELIHSDAAKLAAESCKLVRIYSGERLVFTGIVDEAEVRSGLRGLRLFVCGRGLAALLMQSECASAQFSSVALTDIISRYIRPAGIAQIDAGDLSEVLRFTVESGTSAWTVLRNFCGWSAKITPRFDRNGTLILRPDGHGGSRIQITKQQPVISASARNLRFGLPSLASVTERTSGRKLNVTDPQLVAAGFTGRIHLVAPNGTLSASRSRAEWALAEPKRDWKTAEVTLAYPFAANPADKVELYLDGIRGTYLVAGAKTEIDVHGARTTLYMKNQQI